MTNKLKMLAIKVTLKLQKILHQKQLPSGKKNYKYCSLKEIFRYLNQTDIAIQLYEKDEENKDFIFELVSILGEYGKNIELVEYEKIFNNDDMREIEKRNSNTEVNLRYMIKSYVVGGKLEYDIKDYCKVLEKIEYLTRVTKANFNNKEEQTAFVIMQLADYILYDAKHKEKSEEELREISSLTDAILNRNTVCMGYSMACEHCLSDLDIECNIISGEAYARQPENIHFWEGNHAWNQVKLDDEWYNLDVTWISTIKDEEKKMKNFLVDDESFLKEHTNTGAYVVHKCDKTHRRQREMYNKVKNIKNVLKAYDNGNRSTILQYDVPDSTDYSILEENRETTIENDNNKEQYE